MKTNKIKPTDKEIRTWKRVYEEGVKDEKERIKKLIDELKKEILDVGILEKHKDLSVIQAIEIVMNKIIKLKARIKGEK